MLRLPLAAILTIAACFCIVASHESSASTIDLPKYGFKIDALDATPGSDPTTKALIMFLPAEGAFAPNVNIVIQPYTGTIKDYIALSKGQFDKMKVTVTEESFSATEWRCECSGPINQSSLHWYARAVFSSGKVYLITATASETSWSSVSGVLKKTVASFSLNTP